MTGFEPRTPGIGSDRSTNWATTTAQIISIILAASTKSAQIPFSAWLPAAEVWYL